MPGSYMVRSSVLFERIPNGEIYCGKRGGQNWQILLPSSYKNKTGYIDEPLYVYYYPLVIVTPIELMGIYIPVI